MYYTCTYIKLFRQTGMNLTEGLHARGVSVVSIYTRMLSRAFRIIIIIIKYGCERTTARQTDRQTDHHHDVSYDDCDDQGPNHNIIFNTYVGARIRSKKAKGFLQLKKKTAFLNSGWSRAGTRDCPSKGIPALNRRCRFVNFALPYSPYVVRDPGFFTS